MIDSRYSFIAGLDDKQRAEQTVGIRCMKASASGDDIRFGPVNDGTSCPVNAPLLGFYTDKVNKLVLREGATPYYNNYVDDFKKHIPDTIRLGVTNNCKDNNSTIGSLVWL